MNFRGLQILMTAAIYSTVSIQMKGENGDAKRETKVCTMQRRIKAT